MKRNVIAIALLLAQVVGCGKSTEQEAKKGVVPAPKVEPVGISSVNDTLLSVEGRSGEIYYVYGLATGETTFLPFEAGGRMVTVKKCVSQAQSSAASSEYTAFEEWDSFHTYLECVSQTREGVKFLGHHFESNWLKLVKINPVYFEDDSADNWYLPSLQMKLRSGKHVEWGGDYILSDKPLSDEDLGVLLKGFWGREISSS